MTRASRASRRRVAVSKTVLDRRAGLRGSTAGL